MGKRYFCDYCDRSFQDNLHNRKKHLNGVQHLRAKRAWYDLFRDAAAILQEEQSKKPCRKFLQTGEQRLKELRQEGADVPLGTIEDWLEKRAKRLSAAQSNSALPEKPVPFQYPPGWPPPQELPPSLQAPPAGGWPLPPDLQWG
ncbi:zinc finger matrin-type protein 5 isoform X3 [Anser cygnoides]|uniref:zinc finger matrin-type protein 5 isoform X3 n=1 Tax=Cygnus olor TaxID=8869 RepID=UPI001ADE8B86|nr:zinc finger matrin-type protein 5 isoform X3 [Cygnus olor]XP_047910797.1 zinc finger matrin-type protein 5 isoform X3 [Anser cygnoides]